MSQDNKKKTLHLNCIGNNVFKYEDKKKKFMVREIVSGWQVEESTKVEGKWVKVGVYPIKSLGGIVLEIDDYEE